MNDQLTIDGQPAEMLVRYVASLIDQGIIGSARCTQTTGSTNQDALEEWRSDRAFALPRLHVTETQTAGRGRRGRTWLRGERSLAFSVMLDLIDGDDARASDTNVGSLSLAVGVGAAEALEFFSSPSPIGLKWPNDICIQTADGSLKKLGGILIEAVSQRAGSVVVGIGVNLTRPPSIQQGFPAVSLGELTTKDVRDEEVLAAVVQSVIESVAEWKSDAKSLLTRFRKRCLLTGREITLRQLNEQTRERAFVGVCHGIAEDGSLRIMNQSTMRQFHTGEISDVRIRRHDG
ncbi:MAG: biotin--[acetyl-CoA-carboxylase] ligase [Planctomycetota bacterium]